MKLSGAVEQACCIMALLADPSIADVSKED